MTWANRITVFRIVLAPVFLVLFELYTRWPSLALLVTLAVVFGLSEFSDVLDGLVARRFGQTSELGKLLDPFSDVISRLTVFLCLLLAGIAPLWAFAVILYREIGMQFLRLLMVLKGRVQAAAILGKIKAWAYFAVSVCGLGQFVAQGFGLEPNSLAVWNGVTQVGFALAAVLSVASFIPYWITFRSLRSKS